MQYLQISRLTSRIIFFALSLLALFLTGCAKKTEIAENIRPVRAIQLISSQQQITAEYAGYIQPRVEAHIGFRVSGKISARKVDVGSLVKAGQILMQLDPADLRLAQLQAEGGFKAAQANVELANNELKRYQELRKTNAVSQSMLEAKTTAVATAQGNFQQAQALLKSQSNQAGYTNLIAASSGVVTAIHAEVGQVVSPGMPVVQVAQLDEMEVVVGIPENNVDIISRSNGVKIYLWANPQEAIAGKIRELSPVADPATRTFTAKISIVNPSPKTIANVKMGMTANVQFVLNTPGAFIKIPLTALFQEKGVTSVWIVENNAVKLVPVQIGGVNGNDLLLTSGVNTGQTVVTAGVHLLKPGQRVSILEALTITEANNEPYLTAQTLLARAATSKTPSGGENPSAINNDGLNTASNAAKKDLVKDNSLKNNLVKTTTVKNGTEKNNAVNSGVTK
ncbi:MAG: efflux RND transporter periplasmic adaptor subunit [Pseudomonadota bacterium]